MVRLWNCFYLRNVTKYVGMRLRGNTDYTYIVFLWATQSLKELKSTKITNIFNSMGNQIDWLLFCIKLFFGENT